MWAEYFADIWTTRMREDVIDNHNSLLWEEDGIRALLFCHIRNSIPDYGTRILVVPEYRPTVPENARDCKVHRSVLRRYEGEDKFKIDLCIVEFERDLSELNSDDSRYRDCTLWCFGPMPVVAIEIKFTWKNEILSNIEHDISKLQRMLENWGTELAILCLITDIDSREEYIEFLNNVRRKIRDKMDRFRIAIGSWNKGDLWDVE